MLETAESLDRERVRVVRLRLASALFRVLRPVREFAMESFPEVLSDLFAVLLAAPAGSGSASSGWSFRESDLVPAAWSGHPAAELVEAWSAVFAPARRLFPRTRHSTESLP